jgi:hypothetical protein
MNSQRNGPEYRRWIRTILPRHKGKPSESVVPLLPDGRNLAVTSDADGEPFAGDRSNTERVLTPPASAGAYKPDLSERPHCVAQSETRLRVPAELVSSIRTPPPGLRTCTAHAQNGSHGVGVPGDKPFIDAGEKRAGLAGEEEGGRPLDGAGQIAIAASLRHDLGLTTSRRSCMRVTVTGAWAWLSRWPRSSDRRTSVPSWAPSCHFMSESARGRSGRG